MPSKEPIKNLFSIYLVFFLSSKLLTVIFDDFMNMARIQKSVLIRKTGNPCMSPAPCCITNIQKQMGCLQIQFQNSRLLIQCSSEKFGLASRWLTDNLLSIDKNKTIETNMDKKKPSKIELSLQENQKNKKKKFRQFNHQ